MAGGGECQGTEQRVSESAREYQMRTQAEAAAEVGGRSERKAGRAAEGGAGWRAVESLTRRASAPGSSGSENSIWTVLCLNSYVTGEEEPTSR